MSLRKAFLKNFTVNQHSVLLSGETIGTELGLVISIDGVQVGNIAVLSFYAIGNTSRGSELAIWAGERLFIINVDTQRLDRYDWDDEIAVIYALKDAWCVRGETTVVLFDAVKREAVSRFVHNEVITESHWEGHRMVLRDFNGKLLTLHVNGEVRRMG